VLSVASGFMSVAAGKIVVLITEAAGGEGEIAVTGADLRGIDQTSAPLMIAVTTIAPQPNPDARSQE
jgi:hypothetical protein